MSRPVRCRRVAGRPAASVFKPAGIPMLDLEEVTMTLDEFEAVRLADLGGLHHDEAAAHLAVSRPTFSRIIDSAHTKVADALVHGKALKIEGGSVEAERGPRRCCHLHDASRQARGERSLPPHEPRPPEAPGS